MCSTFKLLAAAAALKRVDEAPSASTGKSPMARAICSAYAPIAKAHVAEGGMTSPISAPLQSTGATTPPANLVLQSIGGPAGFTHFARSLGDEVTRLDRNEPTLNESLPGDPRDTTSPRAMAAEHAEGVGRRCAVGLRRAASCKRGSSATRSATKGCAPGCRPHGAIGDKTGTGDRGSTNAVAIIWPPGRAPLIATVYYTESSASDGRAQRGSQGDRRPHRRDVLTKRGRREAGPYRHHCFARLSCRRQRRCRPSSACKRRGRYRSGRLEGLCRP